MAAKKRKYPFERSQGEKMRETKQAVKKLAEKFPIGEMVSQKYYPNNVGVIAGKPKSDRLTSEYVVYYIDVLWIKNSFYGDGQVYGTASTELKVYKPKKVV